jgi:RNA polymerase sigma factor (sigma-70 family)
MVAYGTPLTAFAHRVLRNHEAAREVCQQVFFKAFQGLSKFEARSSFWSWLCKIAYHRCVDELKRNGRVSAVDDFDVWNGLVGPADPTMDGDRVAKRRALEQCLGKLPVPMRTQLLMRYFFGLSYGEIGEAVGVPHGTVQVRMSRILPRLRRCLRGEGVTR